MQDTLTALAEHHGDGDNFRQLMKDTAAKRFDEGFWKTWESWIAPVLGEPAQIADFGSGPAILLQNLRDRYPDAHLIGVECAPWMLEVENSHYELIEHDLHEANMPIADNSLDAITAIFVLHELKQPIEFLKSIHRCLKSGGRSLIVDWVRAPLELYLANQISDDIFTTANSHAELSNLFTHFTEHNRYSREDVAWMLQQIGFKVLENVPLQQGRFGRWIVEKD